MSLSKVLAMACPHPGPLLVLTQALACVCQATPSYPNSIPLAGESEMGKEGFMGNVAVV